MNNQRDDSGQGVQGPQSGQTSEQGSAGSQHGGREGVDDKSEGAGVPSGHKAEEEFAEEERDPNSSAGS